MLGRNLKLGCKRASFFNTTSDYVKAYNISEKELNSKILLGTAFVVDQLNKQSGLLGLTGKSDFRDVLQAMASGSEERGLNLGYFRSKGRSGSSFELPRQKNTSPRTKSNFHFIPQL